jgi:hypothetical protein
LEQELKRPSDELARLAAILTVGAVSRLNVQSDAIIPKTVETFEAIFDRLKAKHHL